jgi:hypothetical protein
MFIFLSRIGRVFVGTTVVVAVTSVLGFSTLTTTAVPVGSVQKNPSCTVTPSTAVLDQLFTISATGLPNGGAVNLIITFPNAIAQTAPISVSSNGTYTLTESSASSIFPSEQKGTYTYQFVGRMKWPQGTFNQSYATCSVNVT